MARTLTLFARDLLFYVNLMEVSSRLGGKGARIRPSRLNQSHYES